MWAKITRTVHGKDQRADMCTDGQPRTSYTHGHTQTATDILCALMDSHIHPVCADEHPRASGVQPKWAKITRTVHGKGQRSKSKDQHAESKDQHSDMCTDGQPRTSIVCRRTNTDTQGRPVCAGGHPRTSCVY
uniref:Uncharacterized protein n=1 Tax=Brassica campestris TaxID=3711 RepID=A0A3P5Z6L0_BRACM|nr:unnamed protein product [Brassica rapa]